MMKYIHIYALFLLFVFYTSCAQNQTNALQDNTKLGYPRSQLK